MYFLHNDMVNFDRKILVKANDEREARILFDTEKGFDPQWFGTRYDSLVDMVKNENLAADILAERIDTIGFDYGTDSDEFGFLFE